MKAVWVNTQEEWESHKAAGHRIEVTRCEEDALDMPMSSERGSGGWLESISDCFYPDMNTRAFISDDPSQSDCGERFDIEGIAALAAHYGVDITLTTLAGTIHIKSNTKFAND